MAVTARSSIVKCLNSCALSSVLRNGSSDLFVHLCIQSKMNGAMQMLMFYSQLSFQESEIYNAYPTFPNRHEEPRLPPYHV
jgi:hypothetical protein